MKKKILIASVAAIVIAIACFSAVMTAKANKLDEFMAGFNIKEAELSATEDGIYTGEVDAGMISVIVEVSVKNHQIVSIKLLKHKNGKGDDAAKITELIVSKQKIKVDAVSGATLSSKVIQKAVEIALNGE